MTTTPVTPRPEPTSAAARTPLMRQYLTTKQEHPDAFLFFRLGDFYEMFFDDAVRAAQLLGLTLTSRNKQDPDPIPMCGIPWHQRDGYVARLLRAGHKVAICDQLEDPAQAKGIVQQIIQNGSVQRGWLGVAIGPVTPEIAASLNLPAPKGALVNTVTDGSPAGKAGLKEGDIILSYGDKAIDHVQDLTRAVADTKAGTSRDLKILRDGRQQTVKVNIAALKDDAAKPVLASNSAGPAAGGGISLAELGLSLATDDGDVVVSQVKVNSPAADAGIRVGDKLVKVNQTSPTSLDAAKKAVDEAKAAKRSAVLLQLERDGSKYFVGVPFSD